MEGRVYLCSWKRAGGRFQVWLQSNRRIAAEGAAFREVSEALWNEIVRAFDDGEAVLEYQPPPPPAAPVLLEDLESGYEGGFTKPARWIEAMPPHFIRIVAPVDWW